MPIPSPQLFKIIFLIRISFWTVYAASQVGKFNFVIQKTGFKQRERALCCFGQHGFYHFQTCWHAEKKMHWDTVVISVTKLLKMCSRKAARRKVLVTLENRKGRAWNVTLPKCHRFFSVLNLIIWVFWGVFWVFVLFFFKLVWVNMYLWIQIFQKLESLLSSTQTLGVVVIT